MRPATQDDVDRWYDWGVRQGATHLIMACDTYNYEDYPVFVKPGQDFREVAKEYDGRGMQKLMEVYALDGDKQEQIAKGRAFSWD